MHFNNLTPVGILVNQLTMSSLRQPPKNANSAQPCIDENLKSIKNGYGPAFLYTSQTYLSHGIIQYK